MTIVWANITTGLLTSTEGVKHRTPAQEELYTSVAQDEVTNLKINDEDWTELVRRRTIKASVPAAERFGFGQRRRRKHQP